MSATVVPAYPCDTNSSRAEDRIARRVARPLDTARRVIPLAELTRSANRCGQPVQQAGLGEHGEPVRHAPMLDDPAIHDAGDIDDRDVPARPLGGPKNGPVAVPWARIRTQIVSPLSTESSIEKRMSGTAWLTSRIASFTCCSTPTVEPSTRNWCSTSSGEHNWSTTAPSPVAELNSQ
jgi:hypothetical protein